MEKRDDTSFFVDSKYVNELSGKDFEGIATWKLKDKSCSIILFYAPWCPHCTAVKGEWEKIAKMATFMNVGAFNCEKNKSHLLKIKEDMPELVKGYPTIVFYSKGIPVEHYAGDRSSPNLLKECMRICQKESPRK